jgi:Ca2+-binding RTX toxin-like protein
MHGLGLAHPHDTGGNSTGNDSTVMQGVSSSSDTGDYYLNQGHYTMMSYNWQFSEGPVGTVGDPNLWGMAAGPMGFDIAVLQAKYGANLTHNSGSNTYVLGDVHGSGAHWKSIWDTGSIDTMRYNGTKNTTIDLRAATLEQELNGGGFVSAVAGVAGGYTIANGVVIENATGGAGNDAIFGNAADNTLIGSLGRDTINGHEGNDTIIGGQGDDSINGGNGQDYIRGGDDNDTITGGSGADTIEGGDGNDSLVGGADDNKLYGQGGNDTLVGGSQDDRLNGGGGDDFLKGNNGADWFRGGNGSETIWGGSGNDTMFGNANDDVLHSGSGDDTLNGGGGDDTLRGGTGDDYLKGGEGADTFIFENGMGADQLLGFDRTEDILRIDSNLLSGQTTGAQVLATFGSVVGSDVVFDFGDGDTITLLWANNLNGIADDILIV